jgi:hypothetical protein
VNCHQRLVNHISGNKLARQNKQAQLLPCETPEPYWSRSPPASGAPVTPGTSGRRARSPATAARSCTATPTRLASPRCFLVTHRRSSALEREVCNEVFDDDVGAEALYSGPFSRRRSVGGPSARSYRRWHGRGDLPSGPAWQKGWGKVVDRMLFLGTAFGTSLQSRRASCYRCAKKGRF